MVSTEPAKRKPPIGAPSICDDAGKLIPSDEVALIDAFPIFIVLPLKYKSRKRCVDDPKS